MTATDDLVERIDLLRLTGAGRGSATLQDAAAELTRLREQEAEIARLVIERDNLLGSRNYSAELLLNYLGMDQGPVEYLTRSVIAYAERMKAELDAAIAERDQIRAVIDAAKAMRDRQEIEVVTDPRVLAFDAALSALEGDK